MKKGLSLILTLSLLWASGPAQAASMAEGPIRPPSSPPTALGAISAPNSAAPTSPLVSPSAGQVPSLPTPLIQTSETPVYNRDSLAEASSSPGVLTPETAPKAGPTAKRAPAAAARAPRPASALLEIFRGLMPNQAYEVLRRVMDGGRGSRASGAEEAAVLARGDAAKPDSVLAAGVSNQSEESAKAFVPRPAQEDRSSLNSTYRFWRAMLGPILRAMYSMRIHGLENIPKKGGALLLINHVSFVDVPLLSLAAGRPVRFLVYEPYYKSRWIHWFVKQFKPIPVKLKEDGASREEIVSTLDQVRDAANAGYIVAIFPEGTLTPDGMLHEFKRGFERSAQGLKAPVIPIFLDGFWGSFLSRKPHRRFWRYLLSPPRKVSVRFGSPLREATVKTAKDAIAGLGVDAMAERVRRLKKTLPLALLDSAKKFWRRQAVADLGKSLSYGRLLAASVLLAGALRAPLAGQNNVGILLPPSVGGVIANAALSIDGKVVVNLNALATEGETDHVLGKAGVSSILTSRRVLEGLRAKAGQSSQYFWDKYQDRFIFIEDYLEGAKEKPPLIPRWKQILTWAMLRVLPRRAIRALYFKNAPRSLDDTAVLIPTSGSTGLPKLVELTHLNIQANIEMVSDVYSVKPEDKTLGILPFFHSFGYTITLWRNLTQGGFTAYHYHPLDIKGILQLAERYLPTIFFAVPSFLSRYLEDASILKRAFSELRLVITGAEPLRKETAEQFARTFEVGPRQGYGMTELSPVALLNPPDGFVVKKDEGEGKAKIKKVLHKGDRQGTAGLPLPGVAVRIVDPETFQDLPTGQSGMMLVRGPNVMKGYYKDPQATEKVMREGWLVTGDIASVDKEGYVTIVGRESRFSKILGEKISHDLVEQKLAEAAGSQGSFAVTGIPERRPGKNNEERLVVLYAGYHGSIRALIEEMQRRGFKWTPDEDSFFLVQEIPALGSGKVSYGAVKRLAEELAARQN